MIKVNDLIKHYPEKRKLNTPELTRVSQRAVEKQVMEKSNERQVHGVNYVRPFGDLPREGDTVGDGSGLQPLLLPRRLPAPVFRRTIIFTSKTIHSCPLIHGTLNKPVAMKSTNF
ncbi:Protein of unknown function [Cotesia congregata]|uniref:Uncharacterized protein n=1 Tax=Cotesia congregata TaxID=51543 RepID=A0A8J2HAZ1_COTCN|nr:Protein of unknown function [Cotesia congregata]